MGGAVSMEGGRIWRGVGTGSSAATGGAIGAGGLSASGGVVSTGQSELGQGRHGRNSGIGTTGGATTVTSGAQASSGGCSCRTAGVETRSYRVLRCLFVMVALRFGKGAQ